MRAFCALMVGFADGSDFVAKVGNFVSDGRRFAPGLVQHSKLGNMSGCE